MNKCKIVLSLVLMFFVWGCSNLSVSHLRKNPLELDQKEVIKMKYLTFIYTTTITSKGYLVKGKAYFNQTKIPNWTHYIQEMWLQAYLSDGLGRVLAKDIKCITPQPIPAQGINFSFTLVPSYIPQASKMYVTFGYSFKLSGLEEPNQTSLTPKPLTGEQDSFFYASQGALVRP